MFNPLFVRVDRSQGQLGCAAVAGQVAEVELCLSHPRLLEVEHGDEAARRVIPQLVEAVKVTARENIRRDSPTENGVDPVAPSQDQNGAPIIDEGRIAVPEARRVGLGCGCDRRQIGNRSSAGCACRQARNAPMPLPRLRVSSRLRWLAHSQLMGPPGSTSVIARAGCWDTRTTRGTG